MITIMGAAGKTGKWVADALLKKGEKIRVIGRSAEHLQELTERGAEPVVGDCAEEEFLTRAFKDADGVYAMIPPKYDTPNVRDHYNKICHAITEAIKNSGVKKVVFLSSFGADRDAGVGPVLGLRDAEKSLDQLKDVDIVFLRAAFFYENTLMDIENIKNERVFRHPADPDVPVPMVASRDIGYRAAELLEKRNFKGHTVEDIFSDRLTFREITSTLAKKLEIPDLRYEQVSEDQALEYLMERGLSRNMAEGLCEIADALSNGRLEPTTTNREKPNAPTRYNKFVDEVYAPAYRKAA